MAPSSLQSFPILYEPPELDDSSPRLQARRRSPSSSSSSPATAQSGEVWGQCAACRDSFSLYVTKRPGGRVELAETPRIRWQWSSASRALVHLHPYSPTLPSGKVALYGSLERFSDPRHPDTDLQLRPAVYPPAYR